MTTRRDFLRFLGASTYALGNISALNLLSSCTTLDIAKFPSLKDDLILKGGLSYYQLISWGDPINKDEVFGFNNDYINIQKITESEVIMWVNHEYVNPLFLNTLARTKKNVDIERKLVGGTLMTVKKENQRWAVAKNDKYNRGVRGDTKIPFNNNIEVQGSKIAEGTLANCAGGKTPWNTFLTCEENYDMFYGERDRKSGKISPSRMGWETFYPNPPEHYGWVVEVNPYTGEAKKHTNIGRFAHECATTVISKTKKVVVYSGDDKNDEHLYKFISDTDKDLNSGKLYCADVINGRWISMDLDDSPILKKYFKNQLEVHTYAREAAKVLGATPMNRPEDIEIHPETNDVYVALTNNKKRGDYHGQILKITELDSDHSALTFKSETFVLGGELSKISCPDNLCFDKNGNLWVTSDISGSSIGKKQYKGFGNNGLFVIPTKGSDAGRVVQVASAPIDAEFTGPCFSPDYKTLFLSIQHPGERTKDINNPTSTWPTGKMPKPSVVAITGSYLEDLTS